MNNVGFNGAKGFFFCYDEERLGQKHDKIFLVHKYETR